MSREHHIEYVPETPAVRTSVVGWSAFGTLLLLAVAIGGLYGAYRLSVPPGSPPKPEVFPQPRVDTTESQELRRILEQQNRRLETWRWADGQHSLVQVPIERAMQLLAKQGASAYEPLSQPQAKSSQPAAASAASASATADRPTKEPGK
jgi:hypothetical protein